MKKMNALSASSHAPSLLGRLRTSAIPFVAGGALVGTVMLFGGAQEGARRDPNKAGASQSSGNQSGSDKPGTDSEFAGPPQVTVSGQDSSFKGPPPQGGGSGAMPPGTGFNNPGGAVDPAALQAAAAGGIHYHVHYHGAPGQVPVAGYAGTTYVNPANLQGGSTANQYMPGYGPGNPGPLGSEEGNDTEPFVGSHGYTGFSAYGAAGNYFGGPGGYFGGGGGFAPGAMAVNAAYANGGFVSGFND